MIKLNGKEIVFGKFPNGESELRTEQIKFYDKNSNNTNIVKFKFENECEIFKLKLLKDSLDSTGICGSTVLLLGYIPYSRMDRTENKKANSLKTFASIINSMNFDRVVIIEPHSDVCVALLDRCFVTNMSIPLAMEIIKEYNFGDNDYIVFPDAGAMKRYANKFNEFKLRNFITCEKERDFDSGYIKNLKLNNVPNKPFKAVIIDDLCSKGGTFKLTGDKLKEAGATDIFLAVSHCENTIMEGELLKEDSPIDKIYTTNTILSDCVNIDKIKVKKII